MQTKPANVKLTEQDCRLLATALVTTIQLTGHKPGPKLDALFAKLTNPWR